MSFFTKLDNWTNIVTGLGTRLRDKRVHTQIGQPQNLSKGELEDLFAGNGLARKICQAPAFHMFREGFYVTDNDKKKRLQEKFRATSEEMNLINVLERVITFARLYGGAVIVMGANDGRDMSRPLDEEKIKSVDWLTILDRYAIIPVKWYGDPFAPKYGEPELYQITGGDSIPGPESLERVHSFVHESRILRFDGVVTPQSRKNHNNGWNDSVFVSLFEVLRGFAHIIASTETLMVDFSQAVYKYKGLSEVIAQKGKDLIQERAAVIDIMRSTMGAMVLDADGEAFERQATPMYGLPEMVDKWMYFISSEADMPATVLFGRSPSGMNATGDSDLILWYDRLVAERRMLIEPLVERLVTIILKAKDGPCKGREPKDWRIVWNPLWQMDQKDVIDARKTQAETDSIYLQWHVLSPEEVATSRFGGTDYSFETIIDEGIERETELIGQDIQEEEAQASIITEESKNWQNGEDLPRESK